MISLLELQNAIELGWTADTCYTPDEWSTDNPARGQCVVTSLVVQHFLGGELEKLTTVFRGQPESHYRNALPDGTIIDLSRAQYPADQPLAVGTVNLRGFKTTRDKMLHEPHTHSRYELLLGRVTSLLGLSLPSGQR